MTYQLNKNINAFLVDDDFINYVLNPTESSSTSWGKYFELHPAEVESANQAKLILLGQSESNTLSASEALSMKNSIFNSCGLAMLN